jgi:hypothetical protein
LQRRGSSRTGTLVSRWRALAPPAPQQPACGGQVLEPTAGQHVAACEFVANRDL